MSFKSHIKPRGVGWVGGGKFGQEGGDTGIPVTDSCWCAAEPIRCRKLIIPQLKINKLLKMQNK